MANDVMQWLESIGFGQYSAAFAENAITRALLPELTDDDLKELGVAALGHRKQILGAIRGLSAKTTKPAQDITMPSPGSSAAQPDAERRQLTVMFCDLVGSTELSTQLDPEEMRDLIRTYQETCAGVISRYDGYVAKYMGDGVYAYFGFPLAHEDDAERAILSGLELVQTVPGLDSRLAARIGIATGTVVVGDIVGEGAAEEANVIGAAPNLAARLQELAGRNTVVIAPSTRALVGDLFTLDDLGSKSLKGFTTPVHTWRVKGEGRAETRFEAARAGALTALTGRDEESALLVRRWEQAVDGEGQVILLSGEAGIGKSRMLNTLRQNIGDQPHYRIHHQCSPHHVNSAFYPVIERLERATGFARDDNDATKLDKIVALLSTTGEPSPETVSLFADLLSVPIDGRFPELKIDPPERKEQTLDELTNQVLSLCGLRPVLFALEDAHWSDPTTLDLLERLVERGHAARLAIVITCRPEFVAPWTDHPHITILTLNRLGRRDCRAMAARVAGGMVLPDAVLDEIVSRTDGVPLFVEELTKTVVESGFVKEETDGDWPAAISIPATLKDSLTARLDRLGPAKEVAQTAAVIGRVFSHELLAAIVSLPADQLQDALDQLLESGLIFQRGAGPSATYTFKHALVQDSAYDSLLRRRRTRLHARIAAVLEKNFADGPAAEPDVLAYHYTEAGMPELASRYWLEASRAAFRRSAMREAIAHAARGLAVVDGLAEEVIHNELEAGLWEMHAVALKASRGIGNEESRDSYAHALELCRKISGSPQLFSVLFGVMHIHWAEGSLHQARTEAEELLQIGEAADDRAYRLVAHCGLGFNLTHLGEFPAARDHLERALAIYQPETHGALAFTYMLEFGVASGFFLAIVLLALGFSDKAQTQAEETIALARKRQPINLAAALSYGAIVPMVRGDVVTALAWSEECQMLSRKHGFANALSLGRINYGWAQAHSGRGSEGVAEIHEGIEVSRSAGYFVMLPRIMAMLAEAQLAAGDAEDALKAVVGAFDAAEAAGDLWFESPLYLIRGDALLLMNRPEEAEACFEKALEIGNKQSAKSWELRATTRLARLWQSRGKTAEAHDLLAPIYSWFTEGFDTADLKDAKTLLEQLH